MVYVFGNSFRANTKALERSHMRAARITHTHAAGCSLAGNQPEEDSGSSPSPPWTLSPALSPPAVRPGPFPLTQDQARRTNSIREVLTLVQASRPLQSPVIIHSACIHRLGVTTMNLSPACLCGSQHPDGTVPYGCWISST